MQAPIRKNWIWHEIHWGRPVSIERIESLIKVMYASTIIDSIAFEVRSHGTAKVVYLLGVEAGRLFEVTQAFKTVTGPTVLRVLSRQEEVSLREAVDVAYDSVRDVGMELDSKKEHELVSAGLLAALSSVGGQEHLAVQILLHKKQEHLGYAGRFLLSKYLHRLMYGIEVVPRDAKEQINLQAGFYVNIRFGAHAIDDIHTHRLIERTMSALGVVSSGQSALYLHEENVKELMQQGDILGATASQYSNTELSALLAIPYGAEEYTGIPSLHPRVLRPPSDLGGAVLPTMTLNDPSRPISFGIDSTDSLRHTVLMGPSGVGKSTLMLNMILNDIKMGHSVVVIDPKDDLNMSVLARMGLERADDVVCIDPTAESVIGINPLSHGSDPDLAADGVLTVLREVFASSWGQRMEDILSSALMTLTRGVDDPSLAMLPRLLQDAKFRKTIVERVSKEDPLGLGAFWSGYDSMSRAKQEEVIGPIMSKLRVILTRKPLLRTLGQLEPSFHLKDVFDSNKIVLVSLNKGVLGSVSSRFLGSIILSQLWLLTQAQSATEENSRRLVKIYIDEMQDYLSLPVDLADALSQARGYRVGFTLAHQYRAQVEDKELLRGIDANVAHKVLFRLGEQDAKVMAALSGVLAAKDFMGLPRHEVYIQTLHKENKIWVSGKTLPAPRVINDASKFKKYSTQRYGRPVTSIDKAILGK